MPDTPIDQSNSIQSIRLKVPTGTVPVPPVGFGQLHSPSPGVLALRLPDGSVVEVVLSAAGGGGTLLTSGPVVVSAADLLALHDTPKVLVAERGAGKLIVPVAMAMQWVPGATPYTGGADLRVGYADDPADVTLYGLNGALAGWSSAETVIFAPWNSASLDVSPSHRNQALVLTVNPANYAGGNGYAVINTAYMVV